MAGGEHGGKEETQKVVKNHRPPGPQGAWGTPRCLPVTKWVEEVLAGLQLGVSGGGGSGAGPEAE